MIEGTFNKIQAELRDDEKLLWAGKPEGGLKLRPIDAFLVPFSFLWGGFAVFWEYEVVTHDAPWFFPIVGILFVVVGLYFMFGRFLIDAWRRDNSFYGLTDKRIVIVSGITNSNTKSIFLNNLSEVSIKEKRDGSGTIIFGSVPLASIFSNPMAGWIFWHGSPLAPSFEFIKDVRKVYNLITQTQENRDSAH